MFGRGASVQHCGGCGRGIPAGHRNCPACARANGVQHASKGSTKAKAKPKPKKPSRCGKPLARGGTCGGFVADKGKACDRCGKS